MAVSQTEYVAFKAELHASAAMVATSISQLEQVVQKSVADAAVAQLVMADLQKNLLLAAPWSATIEQEVAKSEAKGVLALAHVRALHDATKAEVEDFRRRAAEVESKSSGDKKTKWELSRPKDMEPDIIHGKEEAWSKFKEDRMDYADAVHPASNYSCSGRLSRRRKSQRKRSREIL